MGVGDDGGESRGGGGGGFGEIVDISMSLYLTQKPAVQEQLVIDPVGTCLQHGQLQLLMRRVTLPDSGVWKKMVSATTSAVSNAMTTGMHKSDSTVTADTQHAITALGFPSPCACDPTVSRAVETPRRKYQQKLNHCKNAKYRTGQGHCSKSSSSCACDF